MATETAPPTDAEPVKATVQPELLVSAVLHLMSHYPAAQIESNGRTKLASSIERHLKALAELPELAPVLKATCNQLSVQWADVVERTMCTPGKRTLFQRLLIGPRQE